MGAHPPSDVVAADDRLTIRSAPLAGVLLLEPRVFRDERGFFVETFRQELFARAGIAVDLVQDNHSRSQRGTVRALHFQLPPGQAKLVRCARGSIYDVAVDLRRSSPTFGKWWAVELSDENHWQVWIPSGFAHGFCVTSDVADVVYRCSAYYVPALERGIAWDSPELAIPWPASTPVLSARDREHPTFGAYGGPWFP
ncbi:MAG: dTDP-4-dehydrorhamnose 3,5-epimerase [bacterium]